MIFDNELNVPKIFFHILRIDVPTNQNRKIVTYFD